MSVALELPVEIAADSLRPATPQVRWQREVPWLRNESVVLREVCQEDAFSLEQHLTHPEVVQYLSPPPSSVAGFHRFARWARAQRANGTHLCFVILPAGSSSAVGLMQIWPVEADYATAEWGFAVGRDYWGTGLFVSAAELFLEFVFGTMGVTRLEARAAVANGRGNGVLRKIGATAEGQLRHASRCGRTRTDSIMWSVLAAEFFQRRRAAMAVSMSRG